MTQEANTQKAATRALQASINGRIDRATIVNIHFAPKKAVLIHMILHKGGAPNNSDTLGITR